MIDQLNAAKASLDRLERLVKKIPAVQYHRYAEYMLALEEIKRIADTMSEQIQYDLWESREQD